MTAEARPNQRTPEEFRHEVTDGFTALRLATGALATRWVDLSDAQRRELVERAAARVEALEQIVLPVINRMPRGR